MAEAKQQLDRWTFWEFSKVGNSSNQIHMIAFHDWFVHYAEPAAFLKCLEEILEVTREKFSSFQSCDSSLDSLTGM